MLLPKRLVRVTLFEVPDSSLASPWSSMHAAYGVEKVLACQGRKFDSPTGDILPGRWIKLMVLQALVPRIGNFG